MLTSFGCRGCMLMQEIGRRLISTAPTTQVHSRLKIASSPPKAIKNDWIGPPDPDSNLRPIKFHVPEDATIDEHLYRRMRKETMKWNQEFWASHNRRFYQEKEDFIKRKLSQSGSKSEGRKESELTAEQLSEFYRQFLDRNRQVHRNYNKEWYRRNVQLLWWSLKVKLTRLFPRKR